MVWYSLIDIVTRLSSLVFFCFFFAIPIQIRQICWLETHFQTSFQEFLKI